MLCCGGIDACGSRDRTPATPDVHFLVTLRRFDDKPAPRSYSGPFIPCERRLRDMEIPGIQGRDIRAGF